VEWRRETNLAWKLFISSGVGPIDLVGRMRSIFHVSIWKDFCVGVVYNTLYQFCSHCSLMEIFTTCLAPPESIHNFLKFICDVATLTPPPNQASLSLRHNSTPCPIFIYLSCQSFQVSSSKSICESSLTGGRIILVDKAIFFVWRDC
jgi:hypothetical protein